MYMIDKVDLRLYSKKIENTIFGLMKMRCSNTVFFMFT